MTTLKINLYRIPGLACFSDPKCKARNRIWYLVKNRFIQVLFILLLFNPDTIYSQAWLSYDNYTGAWMDTNSWVRWIPTDTAINMNIDIYGCIYRFGDLDYKSGNLIVYDTLIVNGNFTAGKNCNISLEPGAIFIVYGNAGIGQHSITYVGTGAYLIVQDTLKFDDGTGIPGSFTTQDSHPSIFFGLVTPSTMTDPGDSVDYPALYCNGTGPEYPNSGCTFGDTIDLQNDLIYDFYSGNNGNAPIILTQPKNKTVCSATSTQLTTKAGYANIYQWQVNEGPGFSDIIDNINYAGFNSDTLTINNIPGSFNGYQYRCKINGNLGNSVFTDTAHLTVYVQPEADAGPEDTICGNIYDLQATLSSGTGVWSQVSGTTTAGFYPDNSNPGAQVSVSGYGQYGFTWIETNGTCSDDSTITILFEEQPMANAGASDSICGSNYQLNATPSVGTGIWSMASGPGFASYDPDSTTSNATLSVSEYGSYTFTWTEVNGSCSDDSTITLVFQEQPNANAGPEDTICGNSYALKAYLSCGTGMWSQVIGTPTAVFNPDNTSPDANISVSGYGLYGFTWKETNGSCYDDSTIILTFEEKPVANAGSDSLTCSLSYKLNATPSLGTGSWTLNTGPGTASFDPDNSTPDAIVSVSDYGTYTFTWTEVSVECSDDSTITLIFEEQPFANSGVNDTACGLIYNLRATPSIGTGEWILSSGPGTANFDPDNAKPDAKVSVTDYGTYDFKWTEVNGSCSDDSTITLVFEEQPIADAGPDGSACGLTYSLNATPSVGTGSWALTSGTGTASYDPDNSTPDAVVSVSDYGTYTFTWTETNGECSDDSTITLVFEKQPVADAGPNGSTCGLTYKLDATPSLGTGSWTLTTGPGTASFDPDNSTH